MAAGMMMITFYSLKIKSLQGMRSHHSAATRIMDFLLVIKTKDPIHVNVIKNKSKQHKNFMLKN